MRRVQRRALTPCLSPGGRGEFAGYVLIMFAMLSVCLLGLAALVIDMGFVRLARQQMQTAADAAALEGLRWQGVQNTSQLPRAWSSDPNYVAEVGLSGSMSLTAAQSDQVRRWAASQVVADGPFGPGTPSQPSMFAEYYDTAGGTVNYGAGPIVNFSVGVGDPNLAAAQTTTVPYPLVYQPVRNDGNPGLELNFSKCGPRRHGCRDLRFQLRFQRGVDGRRGRRLQPPQLRAGDRVRFAHRRRVLGADAADQQQLRTGRGTGRQQRRPHAAVFVRPRQPDGPQRRAGQLAPPPA